MPTEELTGKEKEEYMANYDKEVETEQQNRDNEADKFTEQDNLDYEAKRNSPKGE